jgi:hypothetical protein
MSQLSKKATHHVRYDIPSFVIGMPGHQGYHPKADMDLVPGLSYAMSMRFSNVDGVPLNLTPFQVSLVFWSSNQINTDDSPQIIDIDRPGEIVLSKRIEVEEGYEGTIAILLDGEETTTIGNAARSGGIKWGVFLKNDTGHIFGCEVGANGTKVGTVSVRPESYLPIGVLESL